jgi:hypothetical protein
LLPGTRWYRAFWFVIPQGSAFQGKNQVVEKRISSLRFEMTNKNQTQLCPFTVVQTQKSPGLMRGTGLFCLP